MMLAHRLHGTARMLAACCLFASAGCANKVLNHQLAVSREAVDQAQIAGAAQAAPADLDAAVDKLNRANAAAASRNGKDSIRLTGQAQVDANLARARTHSAQARMAAVELGKSNQILQEEINRQNQNQ